ncbi:hypothetical protein BA746_00295 [Vibrio parahaemolyticus]|nr:hypothetical protein ACX04_15900 [Vibrio parahaemolyticus]OTW07893.1 hypothetical protein BA743_16290 [Vibrio parahaemolyticus]OTW23964.1 hypothetical protein BA744_01085 [Vibrio parahaemolyticus]OTW27255.1 hypothetical protein BA746_00295 [Vibrio parahaemolyticus]
MQQFALNMLQKIRDEYGKAMIINSGYRCKNHPDEVNKAHLGSHTQGVAFDIAVSNGVDRRRLVELGLKYGACVGVAKTFVHLDWREGTRYLWSY